MKGRVTIAIDELRQEMRRKIALGKSTPVRVVNQAGLNGISRMYDLLPPTGDVQAKRAEVKAYLTQPISTQVKLFHSGKRAGQFGRKGARSNQLQRVNLIINAARGKAGAKGYWGKAMRSAAGKFKQAAQISQGYLKSTLLPIIRGLRPYCKFIPYIRTGRVARWPGSAGYGTVEPAKAGTQIRLTVKAGGIIRPIRPGGLPRLGNQDSKVTAIMNRALADGFSAEARSIKGYLEAEMAKDLKS